MKNVVKSSKHFFGCFNTLETHSVNQFIWNKAFQSITIRVNRNSKDKKAILLMDFFVSFKIHTNKKKLQAYTIGTLLILGNTKLTNQSKVFIMNSVIHM